MAGTYPDAPAYRLAYDLDGTAVIECDVSLGTSSVMTTSNKQILNNENNDSVNYSMPYPKYRAIVFIFPEPLDLVAYTVFYSIGYNGPGALKWISATATNQTTTGLDGDWVSVGAWTNSGATVSPNYRTSFTSKALSNVTALRFDFQNDGVVTTQTAAFGGIHIYANPHAGVARQLAFWNPISDTEVGPAYFDWGNATQSSNETRQFRIKNFTSYTATNLTVSTNILTDTSPTIQSQNQLSLDNSTWSNSVTLPSLSSGSISQIIYFRRNTSATAALGVYAGRLNANATFV